VNWLVSKLYDRFMSSTEAASLGGWRAALLADVSGAVLEIGAGTGANLGHYPEGLERLTLVEPDPNMRRILAARVGEHVTLSAASADALDLADASVDVAISTLVLCSVPDPALALAELRRVLKPGGRLLFLEHVAHKEPEPLAWQRRIEPVWVHLADGCRLTRDTEALIQEAGFAIDAITRGSMYPAPKFVRPTIRGVAIKRG